MNRRFKASFTIEATFVMAVIFWAIMIIIQAAYNLHDETVGAIILHSAVERLCHSESENSDEICASIKNSGVRPLIWKDYEIQMDLKGNMLTGKKVQAAAKGGTWGFDLEVKVFDPENFLRLISLLNQEE